MEAVHLAIVYLAPVVLGVMLLFWLKERRRRRDFLKRLQMRRELHAEHD